MPDEPVATEEEAPGKATEEEAPGEAVEEEGGGLAEERERLEVGEAA